MMRNYVTNVLPEFCHKFITVLSVYPSDYVLCHAVYKDIISNGYQLTFDPAVRLEHILMDTQPPTHEVLVDKLLLQSMWRQRIQ